MDHNMLDISVDDFEIDDNLWSLINEDETNNQLPFYANSSSSTNPTAGIHRSTSEHAFDQFFQQADALDNTNPTLNNTNPILNNNNNNVVIDNNGYNQMLASSSLLLPNDNYNNNNDCNQMLVSSSLQLPNNSNNGNENFVRWVPPATNTMLGRYSSVGQMAGWVPPGTNTMFGKDPVEYHQGLLKSRLDLACQDAAFSWESNFNTQDHVAVAPVNRSQASTISIPQSQVTYAASVMGNLPKQQDANGSSGNQSDNDIAGRESDMDPADVRRKRRILSNRESARRSRKKRQARFTELEEHVNLLKAENASLLERCNNISQNYNKAAADYRILTALVGRLRAKAKTAENMLTGVMCIQAIPEVTQVRMPSFRGRQNTSANGAVPVLQYNHGPSNIPVQGAFTDIPQVENAQPITSADVEFNGITMQRWLV